MSTDNNDNGVAESVATPQNIDDLKPKMQLTGTVKRLELYGAFIDIGLDNITTLIHISKLGKTHVNRVSDVLSVGDEVTAWVDKIDPDRGQVMLTLIEPHAVDWSNLKVGQVFTGTVTRLENFGAFVNIGAEREGLVHISELSHDFVRAPGDVVNVGDEVEVQVLGFNRRKRRIDLSVKALLEKPEAAASFSGGGRKNEPVEEYEDDEPEEEPITAMEIAMRRALGNDSVSTLESDQDSSDSETSDKDPRQVQDDLLARTLEMQSEN